MTSKTLTVSKTKKALVRVSPAAPAPVVATVPAEIPIMDQPVAVLIQWRNSASARIDAADHRLVQLYTEMRRLEKKRVSDAHWAKKLNRILIRKVLKDRPHRVA